MKCIHLLVHKQDTETVQLTPLRTLASSR